MGGTVCCHHFQPPESAGLVAWEGDTSWETSGALSLLTVVPINSTPPESVSSKQLQRAAKPSALNSLSPKAFWAWLLGTLEAVNLWKLQFSMVTRTVRSLQLTSWAHLYFLEICAFPSHPNTCCSWGKTKQPAIDPSTLLLPAEPC